LINSQHSQPSSHQLSQPNIDLQHSQPSSSKQNKTNAPKYNQMQAAQRQSLLYNNGTAQGYGPLIGNKKQSYSVNQSIDNSYIGINPGSDEGRYLPQGGGGQNQLLGSKEGLSPQNNYKGRDDDKLNRRGILSKKQVAPYADTRNERTNQVNIRQSGSQDVQANYRGRKDKLGNIPDMSLDNNNYSPYRKYKQNKDIYDEPLNVRGGQILSIKNQLNPQKGKVNYRYGTNQVENS
jgi:hypothetical protein